MNSYSSASADYLSDIAAKAQRELFETKQKLQAAQARVTELEAALKPFVDAADLTDHLPENNITSRITHGDLRQARAVLKGA